MHSADFYSDYIEQNCHVLIMILYNLNLACQHTHLKENLKYSKQTRNLKKFCTFISYFVYIFGLLVRGTFMFEFHVWGVLKWGIPESVWFCTGDLPIYTFLALTHPYHWVHYVLSKLKNIYSLPYEHITIAMDGYWETPKTNITLPFCEILMYFDLLFNYWLQSLYK